MFERFFKRKENMNQTMFFSAKEESQGCCGSNNDSCCSSASLEDAIREKAYLLWEEAGKPLTDGTEFWLEAERSITG